MDIDANITSPLESNTLREDTYRVGALRHDISSHADGDRPAEAITASGALGEDAVRRSSRIRNIAGMRHTDRAAVASTAHAAGETDPQTHAPGQPASATHALGEDAIGTRPVGGEYPRCSRR